MQQVIGLFQHFAGGDGGMSNRTQNAARRRHDQRGWYAFIGHIADHNAHAAILKVQKVVEITADLPCWLVVRGNLPPW